MNVIRLPVRRELAVETVPPVSVDNETVYVDFGDTRVRMPLHVASGHVAKIADKLAALAKLQAS